MNPKSTNDFHIVLRLPKATVELIDKISTASHENRSQGLRRNLQRSLSYAIQHELPVLRQPDVKSVLNPTGESR